MSIKNLLAVCALVSAALVSSAVFAQKQPQGGSKQGQAEGVADTSAVRPPKPPVNLSDAARASAEVSSFLSQPVLAEAVAKAQADKDAAREAARDPNAFLAKNGVIVPANFQVRLVPSGEGSGGGGGAQRTSVTIEIRCCKPLVVVITIRF